MIIDCISDLHGYYPKLEGGDLLIVAGDLTRDDLDISYMEVFHWISKQKYNKKILIAGNHDNGISNHINFPNHFEYLCDSGTEFEGLKIWGSPWTLNFKRQNPHCKAFGLDTEQELAEKWALIPDDTDILITHSPSFGNFDITTQGESVGSVTLWLKMLEIRPKVHICGHIHESYGQAIHYNGIQLINCTHVNEHYQPVNNPVRIIL